MEAPAPPQAIEKSLAGEGLLAHVVVSKYVDHLPLYRLERIFAREGIDLSRTTLCDWVADVATALTPIGEQLRGEVTAATYLQTDDTSVTVLDEPRGSDKGRLWTSVEHSSWSTGSLMISRAECRARARVQSLRPAVVL